MDELFKKGRLDADQALEAPREHGVERAGAFAWCDPIGGTVGVLNPQLQRGRKRLGSRGVPAQLTAARQL
jgi:hypothetical protein